MNIEPKRDAKIGIVGAGIAGLAAAQNLYEHGFTNVTILEAQNRIGGRIHTIPFEGNILEMGAQWIHGENGNPIYEYAKEKQLISCPHTDNGIEGDGHFCTDTGEELFYDSINDVIECLDEIKQNICDHKYSSLDLSMNSLSAGQIFKEQFQKHISKYTPKISEHLIWGLFDWYFRFEAIDNACRNLNDLSVKAYTEWCDCGGVSLINLKYGYNSLIDSLINEMPKHFLKLGNAVETVEILYDDTYTDDDTLPKVKLHIKGEAKSLVVDHVILTCSIGFLQKNYKTLFKPPLHEYKINIIKSIGFGTINKVFLEFQIPFWKISDLGFQLIWTSKTHDFLPFWVYDISGFDAVRGQPNVLMAWIGGNGAEAIEQYDDTLIGNVCAKVLRMFLPYLTISEPIRVITSRWCTNDYICGAYSYRSMCYEQSQHDIKDLESPLLYSMGSKSDWPCVMFAGEATDREFYSSTHGALRSGRREAQRIIDYWN